MTVLLHTLLAVLLLTLSWLFSYIHSHVSSQTGFQIFDLASNAQSELNRTGLYKALALCALAQQGKAISEKLLENFSDKGKLLEHRCHTHKYL